MKIIRLKCGNRDYGTIVGWTEGYDWNSHTDISYYAVRMENDVIPNVYTMNVELEQWALNQEGYPDVVQFMFVWRVEEFSSNELFDKS